MSSSPLSPSPDTPRVKRAKRNPTKLTAAQKKMLSDLIAESVHVAFRKGSDHPEAHKAWLAIRAMPPKEWGNVIDFILFCLWED